MSGVLEVGEPSVEGVCCHGYYKNIFRLDALFCLLSFQLRLLVTHPTPRQDLPMGRVISQRIQ